MVAVVCLLIHGSLGGQGVPLDVFRYVVDLGLCDGIDTGREGLESGVGEG
jgi:hypothetical protein